MDTERFWVLGGRYTSTRFHTVRQGEMETYGPFDSREDARAEWKRLSQEHSPRGDMKFSICSEHLRLPA